MNPLHRNDRAGQYPDSWYAATAPLAPERADLRGAQRADVVIVGAGFTGLTAALHLAQKGFSVAILEAHRVGFGASGRNGGQVGVGYNMDQLALEAKLGPEAARKLWDLSTQAVSDLRALVAAHAPDARFMPGVLDGAWKHSQADDLRHYADHLQTHYNHTAVRYVDACETQEIVKTPVYQGGILDTHAGHIHPLRYALGLARAAQAAGVTIYERSEVHHIGADHVATAKGRVTAPHIILAGNGYLPNLNRHYAARVCPINSFIAATEPLTPEQTVLTQDIAVADSRFVVNYFRMSQDNRLLFGGRENYGIGFPKDISTRLIERMTSLFPQLRGVGISHVWGGTLGITMTRVPLVCQLRQGLYAAGGFSGHGVALTGLAGKVIAEAIAGQEDRLSTMELLPTPAFPGGGLARAPLLTLAMTWYSLRDRLGL